MAIFEDSLLVQQLKDLGKSDCDINSVALWLSFYTSEAEKVVRVWSDAFRKAAELERSKAVQRESNNVKAPEPDDRADQLRAVTSDDLAAFVAARAAHRDNQCIALLHLAHEVLLLTRRATGNFAPHFGDVIPKLLTEVPLEDEVYFEVSRLVKDWREKKIFTESVLDDMSQLCPIAPYGRVRDYTSQYQDLIEISNGILALTSAEGKLSEIGRKKKYNGTSLSLMNEEESVLNESVQTHHKVIEQTNTAKEHLKRQLEEIDTIRDDFLNLKKRIKILHDEQLRQAAPVNTMQESFEEDLWRGDRSTPEPSMSPAPPRQDEDGKSPIPSVSPSRAAKERPKEMPEIAFRKGQEVVYRGKDGVKMRGKVVSVCAVSQSYQVLLENGAERNTEASRLRAAQDELLEDLFASESPTPQPDQEEPLDVNFSGYFDPLVESILETFSESAAST